MLQKYYNHQLKCALLLSVDFRNPVPGTRYPYCWCMQLRNYNNTARAPRPYIAAYLGVHVRMLANARKGARGACHARACVEALKKPAWPRPVALVHLHFHGHLQTITSVFFLPSRLLWIPTCSRKHWTDRKFTYIFAFNHTTTLKHITTVWSVT